MVPRCRGGNAGQKLRSSRRPAACGGVPIGRDRNRGGHENASARTVAGLSAQVVSYDGPRYPAARVRATLLFESVYVLCDVFEICCFHAVRSRDVADSAHFSSHPFAGALNQIP